MSELFRIRDICTECRESDKVEDKRLFREALFEVVKVAESEMMLRVNDGVTPYDQLQISAAMNDRIRAMCIRCESKLEPVNNISAAWHEVESKMLEPFERHMANAAKVAAQAEARRLRQKRARVEGKLIKLKFPTRKKESNR